MDRPLGPICPLIINRLFFLYSACLMAGDGDGLVAGARLWDRMSRREPIVFGARTPVREGLLLAQHRDGTNAFFPAVTVSADSLAHPGRGLLCVAQVTGEFSFLRGNPVIFTDG